MGWQKQVGNANTDKHNLTQISTKGYSNVIYKSYKHMHARIRAVAFRSGTGNVSLAMSTVHHFQCFDFNTAFPKDSKWAFDQNESQETRNRRPFRLVCGSTDYSHLSLVMTNPVFPLTTVQGDACWFKMRGNSITSSAADKTISARSREIKIDHAARHDYEIVLSTVGRSAWLPKEEEEEEDQSIDGNRNNNNGGAGSSDEDSDREEDNNVSYWILRIENEEGGIIF